jgi:hypothetical protein
LPRGLSLLGHHLRLLLLHGLHLLPLLLLLHVRKLDAGHHRKRLGVEPFCDDFGLEADQVAGELRELALARGNAHPRPLALDVLSGGGLVRVRGAADDVRNPRDLVDDLLDLLAPIFELHDRADQSLKRHLDGDVRQPTLIDEGRVVLHRHEGVVALAGEHGQEVLELSVIDAPTPKCGGQHVDAVGQVVQLQRLVLVLAVLGNRDQRLVGGDGPDGAGVGEELLQAQGISFGILDPLLQAFGHHEPAPTPLAPDLPHAGGLLHVLGLAGLLLAAVLELGGDIDAELLLGLVAREVVPNATHQTRS